MKQISSSAYKKKPPWKQFTYTNGASAFSLTSVHQRIDCIRWCIGSIISELSSCEKQIFHQCHDVRFIQAKVNASFLELSGKCTSRGSCQDLQRSCLCVIWQQKLILVVSVEIKHTGKQRGPVWWMPQWSHFLINGSLFFFQSGGAMSSEVCRLHKLYKECF